MPTHEGSSAPLFDMDAYPGLQVVVLKRRFGELENTMDEIIRKRMASQKSIKDTANLHKLLLLRTQINSLASQMVQQLGDAATGKVNTARQPHRIPRKPVPSPSPRHPLSSGPTDVETQPSLNGASLPTRQPGESCSTLAVAPIDMKTSFVASSLGLHTPGSNTLGQHAPPAAPAAAAPTAAAPTIQPNHIIYRKLEAAYWARFSFLKKRIHDDHWQAFSSRAKSEGWEGERLYAEELEMFHEDITSLAAIETQHDFLRYGMKGLKTKEAVAAYWKLCVERAAAIPCHIKRQHRRQQQFKEVQDLNHEQEEEAHSRHLGRLPRLVARYSRSMRNLPFGEGLQMLAHIPWRHGLHGRRRGAGRRARPRASRGEKLAKSVVEEFRRQYEQPRSTEDSAVQEQEAGVMETSTQNCEHSDACGGTLRFHPPPMQAGTCFDVVISLDDIKSTEAPEVTAERSVRAALARLFETLGIAALGDAARLEPLQPVVVEEVDVHYFAPWSTKRRAIACAVATIRGQLWGDGAVLRSEASPQLCEFIGTRSGDGRRPAADMHATGDYNCESEGSMEHQPDADISLDVDSDADSWAYCTVEDW
ncbi:predicted protein [Verticillium alfalfae VaMs.102]|uniref:Predicted protein n=1 Tax=Verticillium alfalfae (strain VaMs.102 / ATCC MYA-4576 / FGSC 10136) TaxID=526221 RepID=C9SXW5_VERA1|nr:predicted protein [Verticillium alfalfae VaMs.102]EEY23630.1 predicted protein [Verticillium alfalfae VaMs.102]